jgi:predicted phosphodiesterase
MKDKMEKIRNYIEKKKNVKEICEELELQDYELYGLVELMKQEGYLYDIVNGEILKLKQPKKENDIYEVSSKNKNSFLFISDTHLCSKYDRLDILRHLYKEAEEKGIDTVLHAGDLTDGDYPSRSEHRYELRAYGADEQTDYVINKYPEIKGIKTYYITGNHDYTHIRNNGYDIGKAITKEREDMIYLGQDVSDIKINNLKIRLFHGSKGKSYAKSYKLQRYSETIPLEEKPDILLMGHYHDAFYMKYQGIECYQVPACIDQTPFTRSLGLENIKGAWWVDITQDTKGNIVYTKNELETFTKKLKR